MEGNRPFGLVLGIVLLLGAVVGANCPGSKVGLLAARPGWRATDEVARVALPLGQFNAMGGNWSLSRRDLSIDTWLGTHDIGAVWNSAGKSWQWSFDLRYDGHTFTGPTGARHVVSVADGEPLEGTVWTRVDAQRMRTRGGRVYVFSAASGALEAIHWASADWPRLRVVKGPVAGAERVTGIEQCSSSASCVPVYTVERGPSGEVARITDRAGRVAEFDYDALGQLEAARDGKDVAEGWPGQRYEYTNGQLGAVTNSEGERVELAYRGSRLERLRQVGLGNPEWRFSYLAKSAEGPTTLFTTDVTTPLGATTRYRFDAAYRVHERENPLGEIDVWTWSGARATRHVAASGETTQWVWSGDELVTETLPSGNVIQRTYAVGATNRARPTHTPVAHVADSIGLLGSAQYDAAGRIISRTTASGDTSTFTWNNAERLSSETHASGSTTTYSSYGEHGHPTRVVINGFATTDVYDAVGNLVHSDRPDPQSGGVLERHWDADREIAWLLLEDQPAAGSPTQAVLTVTRRSDGRITRIARPLGGDVFFFYDALGREVSRAELVSDGPASAPTARFSTQGWDADGRLVSSERANGMRREWDYDAAGRVLRERALRNQVVESDVAFTWVAGRPVLAADPAHGFAESRSYDAAGRVAAIVHAGGERTVSSYDVRSRLVSRDLETAAGALLQRVTFGWDAEDRLRRVGDGTGDLIVWTHSAGAVTDVAYASGLTDTRTVVWGRIGTQRFETAGTLQGVLLTGRLPTGAIQLEFNHGASSLVAGDRSTAWLYPTLGAERRLERAQDPYGHEWRYAFDHASNLTRISETGTAPIDFHYNADHTRLLSASSGGTPVGTWSWDEAGYATSRGGNTIEWTARGAIRRIVDAQGVEQVRFDRDPLGRPSARRIGSDSVGWSHGGLMELDGAGSPVAVDLGPVRIRLDGQHVYRHTDQRGNVAFESDANGVLRTRHVYGAFGRDHTVGDLADAPRTFARGIELDVDPVLGPLQVVGARVYDPYAGRFLGPDPNRQLVNDFAYTLGNPIEFWDPTGSVFESIAWEHQKVWLVALESALHAVQTCAARAPVACAAAAVRAYIDFRDAMESFPIDTSDLPALPPLRFPEFPLPVILQADPCPACVVTIHDVSGSSSGGGGSSLDWDGAPGLNP